MILFTLAGVAAYHFLAWKNAVPLGVLAGLLVAPLVPAKGACGVTPPEDSR